jgi:chorismate mutase
VETIVYLGWIKKVPNKKTVDIKPGNFERYYLVREDILPEALVKTVHAKELLARGDVRTIHEAVEQVELSRSAFYKYKDGIFSLSKLDRERIVTISMDLEHRAGILSKVLGMIAGLEGNVLTIHQTIPLQGIANVIISVETSLMGENVAFLLERLTEQEGVSRAALIGQG